MEEISKKLEQTKKKVDQALEKINFQEKWQELKKLQEESSKSDFWKNSDEATSHMKIQSKLENALNPWEEIRTSLDDLRQLSEMNDPTLVDDLEVGIDTLSKKLEALMVELRFNGPFDDRDVLLSVYAGAGGTDAQDWAQMLMRMYLRWAENNQVKARVLEQSVGEEAGIKSVDIELSGKFLYGKLKSEHGVHRLVRLSPFNADAKRQTSFAKVEILPKIDAPDQVPIDDNDLKVDVFRAGGHGGQSVNTTDSAVRITHLPTGLVVSIQNERSQLQNKETAMTILRSRLAQLQIEQHLENLADIKGPNQSAEWGNQIRSYVLHPYSMVKDLRTGHETSQVQQVLDGDLNPFIETYLEQN